MDTSQVLWGAHYSNYRARIPKKIFSPVPNFNFPGLLGYLFRTKSPASNIFSSFPGSNLIPIETTFGMQVREEYALKYLVIAKDTDVI